MRIRLLLSSLVFLFAARGFAQDSRQTLDLSGAGWRLWHDKDAAWQDDPLFLPPVDLAKVPANAPTGGWEALDKAAATAAAVPGTVEEYLQKVSGPAGDITGVTWWWRDVNIPVSTAPRRLLLRFDAVRQRAEVYVNRRLVGYDLIGNSPFEVDITEAARPGDTIQLAVRVTDPGGNFDWRDGATINWGKERILGSHGFGGVTGRVTLVSCAPVYIDNLYLQNTPAITDVNAQVALRNTSAAAATRDVVVRIFKRGAAKPVLQQQVKAVVPAAGDMTVAINVSVPDAKRWDVEDPNLYTCEVELRDGASATDVVRDTFGFRWFAVEGIGSDATFRLNGKRIVLRSAISWGFFPTNGIYATEQMAERQVRIAKEMGQNMLHFHRAIGQPVILEKADELGLLYYEEPGNYRSGDGSPMAAAMGREKLLRMVKRDRNHPSVVIYNMINEDGTANPANLARRERDLQDAHALDPSRSITRTSAWAGKPDIQAPDEIKLHMRPFDTTVHRTGWYDFHHAGGPAVWMQSLYESPSDYYNRTTDREEIVFWGEEGAISTPPRLDNIKAEIERLPHLGWDGQMYLNWHREFSAFLDRKNLRTAFPTVDKFTTALGAPSLYHQGRKIELARLDNTTDGYTINGWEAMILENHSGVVDCFRFPKSDPAIIAHYNQPLYVAVKARQQVAHVGDPVTVDFHLINETDLRGLFTLLVEIKDPAGRQVAGRTVPVKVAGGDTYGQLLTEGVVCRLPVETPGIYRVEAKLKDASGAVKATGRDEILFVDWKSAKVGGHGAVWGGAQVRTFLQESKHVEAPAYTDSMGRLDWLVVARAPGMGQPVTVPKDAFQDLRVTFLDGQRGGRELASHASPDVVLAVADGATPDPAVPLISNYGVRWEGKLAPAVTGTYTLGVQAGSAGARVWIDGKEFVSSPGSAAGRWASATIQLTAGQPVAIKVEYSHRRGDGRCRLMWSPPDASPTDLDKLMARVRDDGTTLVVVDFADTWMELIAKHTGVKYAGSYKVGSAWAGGQHFVREHPLFKDLPVNTAMDWPYQAVVRNGNERVGLLLEGEELVAGSWHAHLEAAPQKLGTAVGVIPFGKGRIVVSTLDIVENLPSDETPAHVARKLLCNYLEFAGGR